VADPKRRWTGQCEYPLTDEYRAGHVATFGSKLDRYCAGCGRLPAWCSCGSSTRAGAIAAVAVNTVRNVLCNVQPGHFVTAHATREELAEAMEKPPCP
jgi:hypothetical protein